MDAVFKLSVFVNMVDNITQPVGSVGKKLNDVEKKLNSLDNGFRSMAKSGMMMAGMGAGMTQAALAPVAATFETRKALGELASLGVKDLESLEKAARSFSDTWAGTTKADFITAAYDIKSGISSLSDEGVAEYTKIAGLTAKATKASVGEMTSLFATGYGIYKDYYSELSDIEFAEIFSAGISEAVRAFKTSGSEMSQAISSLGASATTANVPLEEQLSILGMLQATMSGSEAGTKYQAFLQSAAKAGEKLGVSFVDANNQILSMPEILGLIRDKFGETMDAAEKMQLQEAFGTDEAVDLIDLLYNKTDALQRSILSLYDTMGKGESVAKGMAEAINQTEGEKFTVLKQKIQNTIETIGNGMLPTVNKWMEKGDQILGQIGAWIAKNQELASGIFIAIAVIGVLLVILGALSTVIGVLGTTVIGSVRNFKSFVSVLKKVPDAWDTIRIKALYAGDSIKLGFAKIKAAGTSVITGMKNVTKQIITMGKAAVINGYNALKSMTLGLIGMAKQAITTAATAMPGLIASTWAWTAALLANPVTWIVVGIIALIAVIILLWRNWDSVVAWVKGAWNSAVQLIVNSFNWIKEKVSAVPDSILLVIAGFMPFIGIPLLIIKHWDSIKTFFPNLWNGIKQGFNNFITGWIPNMLQSGKKVISTFVDGIKSMIKKPAEIVKEGLSKVRQLLPFSDAKEGPLSQLTLSGSKVFTTIGEGMEKTMSVPSSITDEAFGGVGEKLDIDKEGFNNFITGWIPNMLQSGKKVISTFVDGIKSMIKKPAEIVKEGLSKVRQLLPFSDAKEGPLSQLTLSGSKVFTTIGEGMEKTMSVPSYITDEAFGEVGERLDIDKVKGDKPRSLNIKESFTSTQKTEDTESKKSSGGSIKVGNIHINFDIKDIEDLKFVKKLIEELKDLDNQDEPDDDLVMA